MIELGQNSAIQFRKFRFGSTGFSLSDLILSPAKNQKPDRLKSPCENCETRAPAAEQTVEKVERFVGRGFSHDVSALDSSGVLTPEARKWYFPGLMSWLKPRPTKIFTLSHRI
jgi:hypothetical protein